MTEGRWVGWASSRWTSSTSRALAECPACHKPLDKVSYTFTLEGTDHGRQVAIGRNGTRNEKAAPGRPFAVATGCQTLTAISPVRVSISILSPCATNNSGTLTSETRWRAAASAPCPRYARTAGSV